MERLLTAEELMGVAYHEAGHMVIAALSGLSLGRCGLRLDEEGFGLACYKKPQNPTSSEIDRLIIAAYAGGSAHEEFYRLHPDQQLQIGNCADEQEVAALLYKRYPDGGNVWFAERERFRALSQQAVCDAWPQIEAVALALLNKGWETQTFSQISWTKSPGNREKCMNAEEVGALLMNQFGITVSVAQTSPCN